MVAVVCAFVLQPAAASFPWAVVPTMCQTHVSGRDIRAGNITGTGRQSDAVVAFVAQHYHLIVANELAPLDPRCLEDKVR